jgi:hypothetical protein
MLANHHDRQFAQVCALYQPSIHGAILFSLAFMILVAGLDPRKVAKPIDHA